MNSQQFVAVVKSEILLCKIVFTDCLSLSYSTAFQKLCYGLSVCRSFFYNFFYFIFNFVFLAQIFF